MPTWTQSGLSSVWLLQVTSPPGSGPLRAVCPQIFKPGTLHFHGSSETLQSWKEVAVPEIVQPQSLKGFYWIWPWFWFLIQKQWSLQNKGKDVFTLAFAAYEAGWCYMPHQLQPFLKWSYSALGRVCCCGSDLEKTQRWITVLIWEEKFVGQSKMKKTSWQSASRNPAWSHNTDNLIIDERLDFWKFFKVFSPSYKHHLCLSWV